VKDPDPTPPPGTGEGAGDPHQPPPEASRFLWEGDLDGAPLANRRVGVFGYGNQGRAQALNLRDSGVQVRVGLRPGSSSFARAAADQVSAGPAPDVAGWADVWMLLVPDEHQPALLAELTPAMSGTGENHAVGFAHGFNVTYDRLRLPPHAGVFLVAPCAPGARMREAYLGGGGVFAYVAVLADPERADAEPLALAYARALGCGRAGVWRTSFRIETEVDLFGEQAVLCGGLHALLTAAYDTLADAGYPPEMAYLECHHQLVWLAASVHAEGIAGTRRRISSTALYGDLTRGPRILGPESRAALRGILEEIQSGRFAAEFLAAMEGGGAGVREALAEADRHPMEGVGRRLRERSPGFARSPETPPMPGLDRRAEPA
jgi:ketol-acid reductoisomerase